MGTILAESTIYTCVGALRTYFLTTRVCDTGKIKIKTLFILNN